VSLVVLLILAAVWGVFLVPQIVRARSDRGPADSIGSFRNQLTMIEQSLPGGVAPRSSPLARRSPLSAPGFPALGGPMMAPRPVYAPPSRSELQRRRQNVLLALLAAVVFTLALGLLFKPAFALNIVADLGLAGYVTLLVRARTIAAEREMKVRYLPGPTLVPAQAEPAYLLRRAGS
jgi:hypothetical protein